MADDFRRGRCLVHPVSRGLPALEARAGSGIPSGLLPLPAGKDPMRRRCWPASCSARTSTPRCASSLPRLQIVLLNGAKRTAEAADALKDYTAKYPDDLRSRLDYLKDLFLLKRYPDIAREADAVRRQHPSLDAQDPYAAIVVSYLRGLSLISSKDYGRAVTDLSSIQAAAAQKAGLSVIVPYARYYLGWAYLRMSDFANAARVFDDLAAAYPSHELTPMVSYLSGLVPFQQGRVRQGGSGVCQGIGPVRAGRPRAEEPVPVREEPSQPEEDSTRQRRPCCASPAPLRPRPGPPTPCSTTRARFPTRGRPGRRLTRTRSSSTPSRTVPSVKTHPTGGPRPSTCTGCWRRRGPRSTTIARASPTASWSTRRCIGEAKRPSPRGKGWPPRFSGNGSITGYRDSSFRGPALQQTAEAYAAAQQYPQALELYTSFIKEYPDQARAARADIRAEQVTAAGHRRGGPGSRAVRGHRP